MMKKKISIVMTLVLMFSIFQGSAFASSQKDMMSKDIVDITVSDGRFKTLALALKDAGLVEILKGQGPYTVFAPTDEAFAKLSSGTLDNLLKPADKQILRNILNYHVFQGKVLAEDVSKLAGKEITMASGDKAKIEVKDGSVYINGAKVIATDIVGKNGVIHIIDTVMIPQTNKVAPTQTD